MQKGFGGLNGYDKCVGNEPANMPWIYDPAKPHGKRYSLTGATTDIARAYHAVAYLTSAGDILIAGSSNTKVIDSSHLEDFSITPIGADEYRVEHYEPSYTFQPRPVLLFCPAAVDYDSQFTVPVQTPGGADVTAVVLYELGTSTHSINMGRHAQKLVYEASKQQDYVSVLTITAPNALDVAPPAFYVLYVLVGDIYSKGCWIQIRRPLPTPPFTIPQSAMLMAATSTDFENPQPWHGATANGATASFDLMSPDARGTGAYGALITVDSQGDPPQPDDIQLNGPVVPLSTDKKYYPSVWIKVTTQAADVRFAVVKDGDDHPHHWPLNVMLHAGPEYQLFSLPAFSPPTNGDYYIQLGIGQVPTGVQVSIDEITMFDADQAQVAQAGITSTGGQANKIIVPKVVADALARAKN